MLVLTAAYTGLRFGELAGLQVRDLDLLRGKLTVRRTVNEVDGVIIVGEPKTAASKRSVDLPRPLVDEIARHSNGNSEPKAWVFANSKQGPMRRNSFRSWYWLLR